MSSFRTDVVLALRPDGRSLARRPVRGGAMLGRVVLCLWCAGSLVMGAGGSVTASPSPAVAPRSIVVDVAQASQLKSRYPFVRFAGLMGDPSTAALPLHDRLLPLRPRPGDAARLITADARRLHGTRVSIRGYMIPVAADGYGVREFVLSSSIDSCHFGLVGGMNEWVAVRLASDEHVTSAGLSPVTVFGTFSVGEELRNGYVTSIYRLDADFVAIH